VDVVTRLNGGLEKSVSADKKAILGLMTGLSPAREGQLRTRLAKINSGSDLAAARSKRMIS
jgi:hypothetical protein